MPSPALPSDEPITLPRLGGLPIGFGSILLLALPSLAGVVLGFIVLDERLPPLELVRAVLIVGGAMLANGSLGQRPLFGRAGAG